MSETETQETVEVTIKLPKQVAAWFKDETGKSLEKRLTEELVELCLAQIDGSTKDTLVEKYGLGHIFKQYGLT